MKSVAGLKLSPFLATSLLITRSAICLASGPGTETEAPVTGIAEARKTYEEGMVKLRNSHDDWKKSFSAFQEYAACADNPNLKEDLRVVQELRNKIDPAISSLVESEKKVSDGSKTFGGELQADACKTGASQLEDRFNKYELLVRREFDANFQKNRVTDFVSGLQANRDRLTREVIQFEKLDCARNSTNRITNFLSFRNCKAAAACARGSDPLQLYHDLRAKTDQLKATILGKDIERGKKTTDNVSGALNALAESAGGEKTKLSGISAACGSANANSTISAGATLGEKSSSREISSDGASKTPSQAADIQSESTAAKGGVLSSAGSGKSGQGEGSSVVAEELFKGMAKSPAQPDVIATNEPALLASEVVTGRGIASTDRAAVVDPETNPEKSKEVQIAGSEKPEADKVDHTESPTGDIADKDDDKDEDKDTQTRKVAGKKTRGSEEVDTDDSDSDGDKADSDDDDSDGDKVDSSDGDGDGDDDDKDDGDGNDDDNNTDDGDESD